MKVIKTINDKIALFHEENIRIHDSNIFLETIYSTSCDTFVFSKENFIDKFYDLKSGFALLK
ncbi:hypothetical protein EHQ52_15495 [Leptospira koniambonensis]|uniref:Uncharacterized protein n=1 Tax=Leptospira koniambonensis TaxID=2484950 RepID=A0A4R9J5C1_9LEPT|nr:hypothetical protein [Leptospira koniambonensis]TGL31340.1 hypothetical protein EHQ52_15495 [Leptospira koniambonensis]